ncbi:MAG: hypothetical protein O7C75_16970, partial [Verrucomicrobia bacterium]|nr:hypothetical protein [Verrucomicrobiota bacterium]
MNQIISSYVEERRLLEMPGFVRDELDYAIRYTPIEQNAFGIICFTRASGENIDEFIEEQVSFIEQKNLDFEWKVYDFDQPSYLRKKLLEKGFEEGDTEAFMVYDLSRFRVENLDRSRFENVQRIEDPEGLREVIKFQETITNVSLPWILNYLRTIDVAVFGMYEEKSLIGTGWIEYQNNSEYADIHGGAVHPDFR